MLSWTTAVAVLLSSVSVLSPFLPPDIVAYLLYWLVVLLLGVFAIASPVILWAVVGTRHLLARVVLLGIFIMVSLAAIGPTSTLVTVVWLAAFAGALRLAGYQLLWRRRIVL